MQRRYFLKTVGGAMAGCLCGFGHAGAEENLHWSYEGGTGPERWGGLSPRFEACRIGNQQSPIDIAAAEPAHLPAIAINWQQRAGTLVNNGETIRIDSEDGGSISLGGTDYTFLQAHFHTPSEHRLEGRSFPMEAHFVHRDEATGTLAVLGVFLEGGGRHAGFSALMNASPRAGGEQVPLPDAVELESLLPARRAYWSYAGSLTTPPCDETVHWILFRTPVSVDDADIAHFRAIYPMNARPVQPLRGRPVLVSQ